MKNYSLKSRLVITGTILLLLVLVASIFLFYTAKQYSFYLERSSRAQHVYSSYRAVSDHTYRKLSAIAEIVEQGTMKNLQERYRNQEALRAALSEVKESIVAELTLVGDVDEAEELEHFNRIELLAEEIIRGSEHVRTLVASNNGSAASDALTKLRSQEVEGSFNRLIDDALKEELREVRETQRVEQELDSLLTKLLSLVFVFFIVSGAFLLIRTWRAVMRNLKVFEQAASAYQQGDFNHRVPSNVEDEFVGLANALNQMASEVDLQRAREQNTQMNLEGLVQSRTKALKELNTKLENVGETRKQFLADISHELRTPLTIMQGEADCSLRGEPKSPEQYIEALRRIKEQTVHTTRFVQDLLFVARAENGKAPMHKRPTDIVPLVLDICDDFEILAAEKNIQFCKDAPDQQMLVNMDTGRINQVITILLDNALRYSYSDSIIEVCIKPLHKQVQIDIRDNGIGLKYSESSQLFSRFYRGVEGAGTSTGTGLGLPVAKAIVDAHDGDINLHAKDGAGTTATVTLPLDGE